MTTGTSIAAEVAQAIREASAELGDGTPLTATLYRVLPNGGTYPASVRYSEIGKCDMVQSERKNSRSEGNSQSREIGLMLAANMPIDPIPGDVLVTEPHVSYHLTEIDELALGGTSLLWRAIATRGEGIDC